MNGIKVNCVYNEQGCRCKNIHIKKSLWGLGTRCCPVFYAESCYLQKEIPKPKLTPPPPQSKKNISIHITIERR